MDEVAVIIDNGSGLVKAGFSNDDMPSCVFPSIVGKPRSNLKVLNGGVVLPSYVGEEAMAKRAILDLSYVLKHGVVDDWQNMRELWQHTFDVQLKVDSTQHPVMLTEPPKNPKSNRAKMAQEMFEYFGVPGLNIQIQAVLSLFSNGRATGLVMDSGDGVTHTIPVWNMCVTDNAIGRVDVAGHNITDRLADILRLRGYNKLQDSTGKEIVRDIKEKLSYMALDYEEAEVAYKTNKDAVDVQYELPDKSVITVGNERYQAPEILYRPDLVGVEASNAIHHLCIDSINKSHIDVRTDLLNNVVLSGGTTMISGFKERLEKELDAEAPKHFGVTAKSRVIATADRKYGVWIGGAKLASLAVFSQQWITKQQYEEDPDIIYKGM